MSLEKLLEQKVVKYAKAQGCLCYKFTSPGNRGVPDRIIVGPTGKVLFLELKAPGKKPTPLQFHTLDAMRAQGALAAWTDDFDQVKYLIEINLL